jgi:hypothetical protein
VLMGALALVQPVTAAFVTHGVLQLAANGWRAALHREHVRWPIIGWYALASLVSGSWSSPCRSSRPARSCT